MSCQPCEVWTVRAIVPTIRTWIPHSLLALRPPSVLHICTHIPWSCSRITSTRGRESRSSNVEGDGGHIVWGEGVVGDGRDLCIDLREVEDLLV